MVYHGLQESDGFLHILKVSIDGGQPVELAHGNVGSLSVSPDGRFVAYTQLEGQGPSSKLKFVVQKVEGGAPVQELDAPFNVDVVGWTPDGRNLSYVRLAGNAGNLYIYSPWLEDRPSN